MTDIALRERLDAMPTDELVAVWSAQDAEQWRPEVFALVEEILRTRGVDVGGLVPPTVEPSTVNQALVRVTSLRDHMSANLCRMALEEAGIEALVSNEHLAGASPPLGIALGFDILVRAEDATAARELLAALDKGEAEIPFEPEPCPKCQSLDNEHVPTKDRLAALTSLMLFDTPRPTVVWETRCRTCGHTWK